MSILNTFTGKTERVGRIVEMHADDREKSIPLKQAISLPCSA